MDEKLPIDKKNLLKEITIKDKDIFVLLFVNYFINNLGYNPVIVHGVNDEVWLENMGAEYKLIRVVSHYIHNDEQLGYDIFKCKKISSKLRVKTLSLKMNTLSIYIDLGENVHLQSEKGYDRIFIKNKKDIKNEFMLEHFPDIVENTSFKEKGISLFLKLTESINTANCERNERVGKIFMKKKPIVTYIFMFICLAMFLLTGGSTDANVLIKYGANIDFLTKGGEYYRLVSSIFIHIGIIHLVFNMYALYILGDQVENFYGKFKYILIFILSGISGGILSISLNSNTISAGASGAIFGLMGALFHFGFYYRSYLSSMIRSQIVPIIIINLVFGFALGGVDNACHIGGLIGGILTSMLVGTSDKTTISDRINNFIVLIIYFGFLIYLGFIR